MSKETIELLKNFTPGKMQFPAGMQQKLDGVPAFVERTASGNIFLLSRQGEEIKSAKHVEEAARPLLLKPGAAIVGELYDRTLPFKDISGQVRDTKQQHKNLRLYVFDSIVTGDPMVHWITRYNAFEMMLGTAMQALGMAPSVYPISRIPMIEIRSAEHAQSAFEGFSKMFPNAEGAVLHSYCKPFQPGKRCWGTQRMKREPTIDLQLDSFQEAVSEGGEPKGMVGGITFRMQMLSGPILDVGVGPGKLTHAERVHLWRKHGSANLLDMNLIAQIKYMTDNTYGALRQPTFQCWRPDKTEADIYGA